MNSLIFCSIPQPDGTVIGWLRSRQMQAGSGRDSFVFDDETIRFVAGDSLATALTRHGIHPTGGGCLCFGGDCPHCVVQVDGVAYVRACQTPARAGMVVESHPHQGDPPLPAGDAGRPEVAVRHVHVDVAVVGGGEAGTAAAGAVRADGRRATVLDARDGLEVVGIYAGPLVVARSDDDMVHVHCSEVVVATGAAEIQPACPGNDLAGIVTPRAAQHLRAAGVDLGEVVAVGPAAANDPAWVEGELVRMEGERVVDAVVVRDAAGREQRHRCDTVVMGLGRAPRDALARMGYGLAVRVVGDAAAAPDLPVCPQAGTVCPCAGVTVEQLDDVWRRGFREMELLKRATLAGTGTCQGGACLPHLRAFLLDRGGELQPAFTARPVTRQVTIGEASAGHHHHTYPRTALDGEHRRLGARMDRIGGWWRPWSYGDTEEEYQAVRTGVSIGDVSTLGKMWISGSDAEAALQKLYPTDVSTIKPGRMRYVLLLNERGYVLDDGMVCREADGERFYLTFTSGGASMAEMWVRDWASPFDVRCMNVTTSVGAINVTGPRARDVLARAGFTGDLPYLGHSEAEVAGVPCKILRLSFTGELSYELHHPYGASVELWRHLLEAGADLGIQPHAIEALLRLRLEKGHILVGQDTDYDSTPRRIRHEWAVRMDKGDFIGRHAITRTDRVPLDRMLVGLETEEPPAPFEGAVIWHGDDYAGYITSATWSPVLGKSVMLAWLYAFAGEFPEMVTVEGRTARRVPVPFYDPEGTRARA